MNPELLPWPERKARIQRILEAVFQVPVVLTELPEGRTFAEEAARRQQVEVFGFPVAEPPRRRWGWR